MFFVTKDKKDLVKSDVSLNSQSLQAEDKGGKEFILDTFGHMRRIVRFAAYLVAINQMLWGVHRFTLAVYLETHPNSYLSYPIDDPRTPKLMDNAIEIFLGWALLIGIASHHPKAVLLYMIVNIGLMIATIVNAVCQWVEIGLEKPKNADGLRFFVWILIHGGEILVATTFYCYNELIEENKEQETGFGDEEIVRVNKTADVV